MVIDYSKWDHISTDSSDDEGPKPKLKIAEAVVEASSEQATEEQTVQCIRVPCKGEAGHWEILQLPVSHPVLSAPISPVSQLIGLPLRVYRQEQLPNPISHPDCNHYANQLITYLMIDPVTGFAPFEYLDGVGTALVCRSDLKPISEQHLEAVWKFCCHLIYMYGCPDAVVPYRDITRPAFERFFRQYKDEKASSYRDIGYPNQDAENWQNVGSPFDV